MTLMGQFSEGSFSAVIQWILETLGVLKSVGSDFAMFLLRIVILPRYEYDYYPQADLFVTDMTARDG